MPQILAHRGNLTGPDPARDSTLPAIEASLSHGWGIALDVRRTPGGLFHCSCDPRTGTETTTADDVCELLRRYPAAVAALRLTDWTHAEPLTAYLREQQVEAQAFLFDLDRIGPEAEATMARLRTMAPRLGVAARVSDHREPVECALGLEAATVVWLDEFDRLWATARDVRRLKNQGRRVFAASPDLHGYPLDVARRRWEDFIRWDVDGIATDYPGALANTLHRLQAVPA